jgi:hypothetical protein
MIAEGAEAKRKEDEVNAKKRKAEADKKWEGVCTPRFPFSADLLAEQRLQSHAKRGWETGERSKRAARRSPSGQRPWAELYVVFCFGSRMLPSVCVG